MKNKAPLDLPYFYGAEAEKFSFYRVPKVLFADPVFENLSTDSKLLYGLMLDRVALSVKNKWEDKAGKIYIFFTLVDIMEILKCADNKATKMMQELENHGLIERKRQGSVKPALIYVKDVSAMLSKQSRENHDSKIGSFRQTREKHDSRLVESTTQDSLKSRANKTDEKETDVNETDGLNLSDRISDDTRLKDLVNYFSQVFHASPSKQLAAAMKDALKAGLTYGAVQQAIDDAAARQPDHPSAYTATLVKDYIQRGGAPTLSLEWYHLSRVGKLTKL